MTAKNTHKGVSYGAGVAKNSYGGVTYGAGVAHNIQNGVMYGAGVAKPPAADAGATRSARSKKRKRGENPLNRVR